MNKKPEFHGSDLEKSQNTTTFHLMKSSGSVQMSTRWEFPKQ